MRRLRLDVSFTVRSWIMIASCPIKRRDISIHGVGIYIRVVGIYIRVVGIYIHVVVLVKYNASFDR